MIKRSRFFELATLEQPTDAFDKDVLVDSNSVTWTPDATTVTVRFPHSVENSHYYVIWSKNSALAGDVHRSKAVTLPEGAVLGSILE